MAAEKPQNPPAQSSTQHVQHEYKQRLQPLLPNLNNQNSNLLHFHAPSPLLGGGGSGQAAAAITITAGEHLRTLEIGNNESSLLMKTQNSEADFSNNYHLQSHSKTTQQRLLLDEGQSENANTSHINNNNNLNMTLPLNHSSSYFHQHLSPDASFNKPNQQNQLVVPPASCSAIPFEDSFSRAGDRSPFGGFTQQNQQLQVATAGGTPTNSSIARGSTSVLRTATKRKTTERGKTLMKTRGQTNNNNNISGSTSNKVSPAPVIGGNSAFQDKNVESNLTKLVKFVKLKKQVTEVKRFLLKQTLSRTLFSAGKFSEILGDPTCMSADLLVRANKENQRDKLQQRFNSLDRFSKQGTLTFHHTDLLSSIEANHATSNTCLSKFLGNLLIVKAIGSALNRIPTIQPQSSVKLIWDLLLGIVLMVYFFFIPVHVAIDRTIQDLISQQLEYILHAFILFDILISMNTAYFEKGVNVVNKRAILAYYFSNYAFTDIISQIPLFYSEIFGQGTQFEKILVLSFFVKIRNFMKIFKKFEESFHLSSRASNLISLFKLILTILFFSHIFSCVWIFTGKAQTGSTTWFTRIDMDDEQDWLQQYVAAYYFSTVTMITVGYGDITPSNNMERMVSVGTMLISCVIFAYTINQIGTIFADLFEQDRQIKEFFQIINDYMDNRNIAFSLQYQIREYLDYYWREQDQNKSDLEKKIIDSLSDTLREKLMIEANRIVLKDSSLFNSNFSSNVLLKMIPIIHTIHTTPNQIIFTEGQFDEDMFIYFIEKGKVEVCRETFIQTSPTTQIKIVKPIAPLGPGSSFGAYSFLTNQERRETVRTLEFSKLLMVRRSDFLNILSENPYDLERFNHVKDSVLFENNFAQLDVKCAVCSSYNHDIQHCHFFHFSPDKYTIIKRQNFACRESFRDYSYRRKSSSLPLKLLQQLSSITESCVRWQSEQQDAINQYASTYLPSIEDSIYDEECSEFNDENEDEYEEDEEAAAAQNDDYSDSDQDSNILIEQDEEEEEESDENDDAMKNLSPKERHRHHRRRRRVKLGMKSSSGASSSTDRMRNHQENSTANIINESKQRGDESPNSITTATNLLNAQQLSSKSARDGSYRNDGESDYGTNLMITNQKDEDTSSIAAQLLLGGLDISNVDYGGGGVQDDSLMQIIQSSLHLQLKSQQQQQQQQRIFDEKIAEDFHDIFLENDQQLKSTQGNDLNQRCSSGERVSLKQGQQNVQSNMKAAESLVGEIKAKDPLMQIMYKNGQSADRSPIFKKLSVFTKVPPSKQYGEFIVKEVNSQFESEQPSPGILKVSEEAIAAAAAAATGDNDAADDLSPQLVNLAGPKSKRERRKNKNSNSCETGVVSAENKLSKHHLNRKSFQKNALLKLEGVGTIDDFNFNESSSCSSSSSSSNISNNNSRRSSRIEVDKLAKPVMTKAEEKKNALFLMGQNQMGLNRTGDDLQIGAGCFDGPPPLLGATASDILPTRQFSIPIKNPHLQSMKLRRKDSQFIAKKNKTKNGAAGTAVGSPPSSPGRKKLTQSTRLLVSTNYHFAIQQQQQQQQHVESLATSLRFPQAQNRKHKLSPDHLQSDERVNHNHHNHHHYPPPFLLDHMRNENNRIVQGLLGSKYYKPSNQQTHLNNNNNNNNNNGQQYHQHSNNPPAGEQYIQNQLMQFFQSNPQFLPAGAPAGNNEKKANQQLFYDHINNNNNNNNNWQNQQNNVNQLYPNNAEYRSNEQGIFNIMEFDQMKIFKYYFPKSNYLRVVSKASAHVNGAIHQFLNRLKRAKLLSNKRLLMKQEETMNGGVRASFNHSSSSNFNFDGGNNATNFPRKNPLLLKKSFNNSAGGEEGENDNGIPQHFEEILRNKARRYSKNLQIPAPQELLARSTSDQNSNNFLAKASQNNNIIDSVSPSPKKSQFFKSVSKISAMAAGLAVTPVPAVAASASLPGGSL